MNVERPLEVPLAEVVEAVGRARRWRAPSSWASRRAAALEGFPQDRPAARLRSRSPPDRERTRLLAMAQTQAQAPDQAPRQRRRRGRVARAHRAQADRGEKKRRARRARAREARSRSTNATGRRPGGQRSCKAMVAAVVLLLLIVMLSSSKPNQAIALFPIVLACYTCRQLLHRQVDLRPPHAQARPKAGQVGGKAPSR